MNQTIRNRVAKLREAMERAGVDYYMVPTADFHNSEYVDTYFKVREYLSGFTGSNGTLVVSRDEAGLWTDGRYFIQAENELEGTGITLFRMLDEGVPTIKEYLKDHMKEGNYVIIVFERYAIFRSMCPEFRRYFRILDKEKAFLHGNISVRKSNGIAFHIAAPDIKQPHQIIQLAEEESIGLFLLHGLPNIFQLFSSAFSAYRLIQHHDRMAGKRRSVRPNLICQIFSIGKRNFLFLKDFFKAAAKGRINHPAVKA